MNIEGHNILWDLMIILHEDIQRIDAPLLAKTASDVLITISKLIIK